MVRVDEEEVVVAVPFLSGPVKVADVDVIVVVPLLGVAVVVALLGVAVVVALPGRVVGYPSVHESTGLVVLV